MGSEHPSVLAVDLDGTLLRSNMLFETFWSAFSASWSTPLRLLPALARGRSHLKYFLHGASSVDVSTLPYNPDVVAYIGRWKQRGGEAVLVTATNVDAARRIADHLGLFDDVIGSERELNLKGSAKAQLLCEHYGKGNFAYIGDSWSDLAVWRDAAGVIACAPSARLAATLRQQYPDHETLGTRSSGFRYYLRAIRVHQWAKNPLVFLPMIGAHQFDGPTLTAVILAFLAFSLIASSVYVLNDLLDLGADRRHPRKRLRPFASGAVPIEHGMPLWFALFGAGVAMASLVGMAFLAVLMVYLAITTAYSLYLKRKLIIDVCTLAGLYTIRVAAGAVAADVPLSMWMLAFALFLFFSLAAIKRHGEIVNSLSAGEQWTSGRGYHSSDLGVISQMGIAAGYVSVLVLALYISSSDVGKLYGFPQILWGVCPILLYWISRMSMVASRGGMHDDPIVYAATDRISLACVGLILLLAAASTNMFGLSLAMLVGRIGHG